MLDDLGEFFGVDVLEEVEVGFGWGAVGGAEDSSAGAVDAGVVVTFAGVGSVEGVEGSVGAGGDFEAAEPGGAGAKLVSGTGQSRSTC